MGGCWIKYQLFKQELAQRTKAAGRQGTNTGKCCSPPTRDQETGLLSLPRNPWLAFLGLQPQLATANHRALPMAGDQAQPSPANGHSSEEYVQSKWSFSLSPTVTQPHLSIPKVLWRSTVLLGLQKGNKKVRSLTLCHICLPQRSYLPILML